MQTSLLNVPSFGKFEEVLLNYRNIVRTILILKIPVLILLTYFSAVRNHYQSLLVLLLFITCDMVILVLDKTGVPENKRVRLTGAVFYFQAIAFAAYLLYTLCIGCKWEMLPWVFVLFYISVIISGIKVGTCISVIYSLTLFASYNMFPQPEYIVTGELIYRLFPSLFLSIIFLFCSEYVRLDYGQKLRRANKELTASNEEFQRLFSQLEKANEKLTLEISSKEESEEINKTLFAISNAVNTTSNLNELYKQIHHLVGSIIDATNFFIAIVNEKQHTLYFPYYVDAVDEDFSPITDFDTKKSLTGYVVSTRKPVLLKQEKLEDLAARDGVWGPVPLIWMGVPLVVRDEIIGVMVVQSYSDPDIYNEKSLDVLVSISAQMAIAIDRKRTVDELTESEKKYRYLFENGSDLICLHDLSGHLLDTNLHHKNEYGYQSHDLKGTDIRDIIPDEYKTGFENYLKRIVANGEDEGYLKGYTKSGQKIILEYRNKLILGASGAPKAVQGTARDITDRWKAEKKLESSEKRYRTLFEKAEDAIFIIDTSDENSGRILDANQSAAVMHGYSLEEMKTLNIDDLHESDSKNHIKKSTKLFLNGEWLKNEVNHAGKNGKSFPVEFNTGRIEIDKSECILAIGRDISERKEFERRLRKSEKMEAIGNLAGGIAHDFNNILTPIIGLSEMMLREMPEGSPEHEDARDIFNAGRRGSALVKQILAFSRQSEHKKIPVRIQRILKEVLKLSRSAIPSDVRIQHNLQEDCGYVVADPTQIHQIAMNLITNAYQAVEKVSGSINVTLNESVLESRDVVQMSIAPGKYVVLSVNDNGVGIERENISKIFEPYFSTKERGKGTGLGLATVYGIVKQYEGDIEVKSVKGKETTFTVYLPCIKKKSEKMSMEPDTDNLKGSERILFVDDEELITRLAKRLLKAFGYHVSVENGSLQALEKYSTDPEAFDLVITDMVMPTMTGDQLARKIKRIRPEIPVIMCTGFSERVDHDKIEELGLNGLLMKPIEGKEMINMIRQVMDGNMSQNPVDG